MLSAFGIGLHIYINPNTHNGDNPRVESTTAAKNIFYLGLV